MPETPMNVLFITADQWRGDALGALGHTVARTPSLDRLAAGGVVFRRHFGQASPCGPARASLHTGLYLHNHRSLTNGTPLDGRHATVAGEARRAGYDPVLFGYTDTTADPRGLVPGDPRLTTYEGVLPGLTPGLVLPEDGKAWLAHLAARGADVELSFPEVYRPRGDVPFGPARFAAADSETAFLTGRVLDFLRVRQDEPWFVHLSYLRPHPPWVAPEPYDRLHDPAGMPPPVRAPSLEADAAVHPLQRALMATEPSSAFFHGGPDLAGTIDGPLLAAARATYFALISEVDHHVGRLLDFLGETGQAGRTLVVFTADHGELLGDHHRWGKRGWQDAAFHVPLVICDPRCPGGRGRIVEAFTEAVDVMPTILDRLGLEAPAAVDGRSLTAFLEGRTPERWRREAHWGYDFRDVRDFELESILGLTPDQCSLTVIRAERYKYVHFTALPPLLFDMAADPGEARDLSADPVHREIRLDLVHKMLSWRLLHEDRTLANHHAGPGGIREWRGPRE
jgi:arylsulfatase A-like enzyme